ncbi:MULTISPECIES: M16 family metallopeptidase [unclassified Polaribacter]|uniref:M16 family metallopeptidase n=1 Tax=unclassified Polaribacter TaxID=196858 RepID=UPI0011BE3327|nr:MULTISPECIES: pitrilysin family protein [unclassified Polaribacter]TXD54070.1 insulinase family protein [Polaribacter sp. IC063]TXD62586.1 insulinase family protein [Polaribacter sp. IC066]
MKKIVLVFLAVATFLGCQNSSEEKVPELSINYKKIELDNGLDVVFHVDKSDPVVAVELMVHVGSAREIEGRTGFAHLFEHLLFLESENLGKGGLDKMSAKIGGSGANGSTSRDRTNYLQTIPKDGLEKMIWAEADKLGWFINTVTDPVLAKEKQVVKNEKRQSVDNRPYGHNQYVIDKNLYPKDHPYNWQVIGSLEDLQNATLEDVKTFFKKWYVPNNSTLVLSGDIDIEQATKWVHQYFDEIPKGDEIPAQEKRAGMVAETKSFYYEDNFARVPQLTMAWPAVASYHPDSYALEVLTAYLSSGKSAPLNKVLVDDLKLTSFTGMYNYNSELAGQTQLSIRAFDGIPLDTIKAGIELAFAKFEAEGISEKDLNRIKAGQETSFYRGLSSVLGKGTGLASYNTYTGNPGFVTEDLKNTIAVTTEDVMRVYKKYIQNKNYIATSFVPKNAANLALTGAVLADVVEEKIVTGAEEKFDPKIAATYEKTPSSFDRSIEPPYGETPSLAVPEVYKDELANGLKILGIENDEVPLVLFNLTIDGGQLLESMDKLGLANLTADLLNKGTQNKTAQELEEAIQELGASIDVYSDAENISLRGTTLAKNYEETLALAQEILLEPRFDEAEFTLLKKATIARLNQQKANPNSVARNAYNELIFGKDNIRSKNILGTVSSVEAISIEDVKAYYNKNISPSVANMLVIGDISEKKVVASLRSLNENWAAKEVTIPAYKAPATPTKPAVYFYDIPNAKQSVLQFGAPALAETDADYYPATVMNYILGGGGFASRLTQELREGKGYTYGIGSGFSGTKAKGAFTISSGVRSNVTLESAQLVKKILEDYPNTFSDKDLETTKSFLIKSNARAFETAGAKLRMLSNMSTYGWESDYVKDRENTVNTMTKERITELANTYISPDKMIWLVVGDAETQLERMKELGYGEPILLNERQKEIKN